ncbi:DUF402 domain-containing protein [Stackebrandtia soli]|uniref:DUF402 domain-containing protein n=1 Tax=Stackebrandtia soli TaxID=1892856 RepID=UPI0039ED1086
MRFQPGQTALRRYIKGDGRIGLVHSGRVVADDENGLLTWVGGGSGVADRVTLAGEPTRKMPFEEQLHTATTLRATYWHGQGVLQLTPVATAHSVWWFFADDMSFRGWYVNLELPERRWDGGVDTVDQALDVWIGADGSWQWKDEDEFAERTGHPLYWDEETAAGVRAEGEAMIRLAEAGAYPFDGTWCDFRPGPDWEPTPLPWWWDRPPAGDAPTRVDHIGR